MPSIRLDGLDDLFAKLKTLADGSAIEKVQKHAVFEGMRVIKDEVEAQIRALPEKEGYIETKRLPRNVVTKKEKAELLKHIGISKMEVKNGDVNNSISFEGYTSIKTAKYPNGIPAVLIARSINSGSSVRQKHPFMRQARAAAKQKAIQAATDAALESLGEIMEG